jgi:TP901 family phage tail tape measure protein
VAIRTTGVRYDLIARDSASRTFDRVAGRASVLDRGLGRLAKTVTLAGGALAGGLAVGLGESAKKAVEFQSEMKKVQTQAGGTARDVAVLSKGILQLGKTSEQGPQQLADAMYHLKSVGLDNVSAMKDLKAASDLAALGGSNLEDTTNALAGAWRSGIKGAGDFSTAAATVNAIIGAGNMRMEDFVAAIGTGILPSAKSFGLSLKQVGGALALMTDEGIPAVDAATRLRMSFSLLGAPSAAADKQLKKIGLNGLDLAKAMRGPQGLIGAVSLLRDHLDKSGLSAERQSQILSRAFGGGRSSSGILTLLNNLDVLRKKQDQVNSSMGKYGPAVAAQRKTAGAQLKILESNLDVFAIKIGMKLLPPITSFVSYLNKSALPEVGKFSTALVNLVPVDQIESGFSTVSGLIGDFFNGLTPKKKPVVRLPSPTIKAPATLIPNSLRRPDLIVPSPTVKVGTTRIPATVKAPAPVKSQATKLGEQLRGLISGGIGDAIGNIDWGKLGKQIGEGLGTAFQWVTTHTADIAKKLEKALGGIDWTDVGKSVGGQSLGFAIGFITSFGMDLFSPHFWEKHWWDTVIAALSFIGVGKVAGPLAKVFERIPVLKAAAPMLRKVGALTKPIGDAAGKVAKFFGESLWKGLVRVFPDGTAVLERESGLFTTRVGVWGLRLVDAGRTAVRGLGNGIKTGFAWVIAKIGEGIGYMLKPFVGAGGWLIKRGGEFVGGLTRGISRGATRLGGWVSDHVISPVVSPFRTAGRWLVDRGSAIVSGLKDGALSVGRGIGGWFQRNVIDHAVGAFDGAKRWLTGSGADMIRGLIDGTWAVINDAKNGIGRWASLIKDKIVGAIKDVFHIHSPSRVMMELGGHIMSGLLSGLLSGKAVLESTVKGIFKSPLDAAQALLSSGVNLPAEWLGKLLSAKAPQSKDIPLSPNVASAQQYAAGLVGQLWPGNAAAEMDALRALWNAESGWRANAENMSSGAYGIPQALPANKMASAGSDWQTNAATQIRWGLSYISGRYGDPITAWASWNAHKPHWYASGGLAPIGQTAWVGEKGPELMQVTPRGTRIYSNQDSMALAGYLGMQVPGYASGTVAQGRARSDVTAAQRRVDALEREIAALRHDEAVAHSKSQRKRDRLAIQAAEEELKAARKKLAAADKELSNANARAKRVQSVANTLANGFLKSLETGSASAIASAVKSINSKLQTAGFGRLVPGNLRTSARLQSLANQRSSIQSQIAAARQFASDQASGLGDFLSVTGTGATNISDLIGQMRTGQGTASRFAAEVQSLSKRGLSKTLLSQLAQAGPGSQLAAVLAGASAGDIRNLNKAAAAQDKLTTSFGRTMADAMFDSGKDAGKGFLSGLLAQEKQIQAEMNKLARGMVATIKKALGIKSPSTVLRDQVGKQVALGAAVGVRQYAPHAVREAQQMADTMAAVRARSGSGAGRPTDGGGRTAVAVSPVVHVHFSDPKLRDLIRVEVDNGHIELTEALRAGGVA